jgi:hypothetical protein
VCGAPNFAECIDLYRDGDRKSVPSITLPAWHCRVCGYVPVLRHAKILLYGGDGTREVYGLTCTLASLVSNWMGRCCESLAFTCTIDRVLFPGASALITMPVTVPVPLAPGVFG